MTLPAPHRDDSPSDLELLTARGWSAIPWDYNALISLVFESSGLGRLTLGYGQFIYGLVNFRFAVHDNNTLLIEYERTPGVAYIPDFVPDPAHAYKNVQYSLVPNHGSGATDSLLRYEGNAVLHPFAWDFRLTLNDSPFPYNLPEPDFRSPTFGAVKESALHEYYRRMPLETSATNPAGETASQLASESSSQNVRTKVAR